ncbi:hypothetical protein [Heyndrickxia vini]|uniref:Uncharacterized protein n=1 Tax=Heyndrickxia vini TaxID=1476025 RepID=A0ABX7E6Q8_9BACI|nr:hypothetical protein [Heyndrickxia vini]QQZ10012.1 hypothetical protein I5776_03325 [Heyndrickxia vini]
MSIYYIMLIVGIVLILYSIFYFVYMYVDQEFTFFNLVKAILALLIGVSSLVITLPSLKYIVHKEYDVVSGKCVIEITSAGRTSEADFTMPDTDDLFTFNDVPDLDAYGKAIPYYCKVTVTKDHKFEISYKIYDAKTRKLLVTSE